MKKIVLQTAQHGLVVTVGLKFSGVPQASGQSNKKTARPIYIIIPRPLPGTGHNDLVLKVPC